MKWKRCCGEQPTPALPFLEDSALYSQTAKDCQWKAHDWATVLKNTEIDILNLSRELVRNGYSC
ncbi:hypothetical protein PS664_03385 [Pseudomonas fluorescens]|jgi:hypothetical protein|nr:hypothetical protein PS664_03385 [Pseudomonas fluorescens]